MSSRLPALITLTFLLAPAAARAETRLVPIVFNNLAGKRVGDDLVIEYRITNKSWKSIEGDRLRPQLHVALENADRGAPTKVSFDREISRQEGVVTLSVPNAIGRMRCEVWVTGGHRGTHIAWMDLGGVEVERASLRIGVGSAAPPPVTMDPPPVAPPSTTNWAAEPRIIEACGAAFDGPANEKACVTAVKNSARDPMEAIAACEAMMDGDNNELECVRVAITLPFHSLQAIAACEAAMDGDANELECLRIATRLGKDPTQVIAACDSARSGDPDELDCLRTAAN
jgi:hypothetical protein